MRYILSLPFLIVACSSPSKKSLSHVTLDSAKSRQQYEAYANQYMVSSQGVGSTAAAIEVLKKGGNLFDAFTALSFAIGVERPHSTGIGGGGFLLFYDAHEKKVYSFDFRETAPAKAHAKMYLDSKGKPIVDKSLTGALAVATPGHVAGVLEIHKKYGKLSLQETMAPAIRMAEEGITVYPALHKAISLEKNRLSQFRSSKALFLSPLGEPWPVGHVLKQPELAQTMRLISQQGAKVFYQGTIANKIAASVKAHQGILNLNDLKNYKTKWRDPVQSTYRNYEIYSQPPPSSGGTHVIEILNVLEKLDLKKLGPQHPDSIHYTASAMQRAFYDRAQHMGDPDFVKVPVSLLTSKSYAEKIRLGIQKGKAKNADAIQLKAESPETTHFSLMDSKGNVVVSTQTINGYFGSALVAEGTGIVLNNEMDDFAAQVGASNLFGAIGGSNNLVAPLKRPLSSMSPTLVLQGGEPVLALGTPSGTRIITCVAQTLLNVLEYELPLWEAVTLTRYHHQWQPDQLQIEPPSFSPRTLSSLSAMGYKLVEKDPGCRIQAIRKQGQSLQGVSDPREEGSSQGF